LIIQTFGQDDGLATNATDE